MNKNNFDWSRWLKDLPVDPLNGIVIALLVILVVAQFWKPLRGWPRASAPFEPPQAGRAASTPSWLTNVDQFKTLDQVQAALRKAGLESSNLIFGIDFTASNHSQGEVTFGKRSLHYLDPSGETLNPYQNVISALGRTLAAFDEDNLIPAYGFGDITTKDRQVFPFLADGPCKGIEQIQERYKAIVPHLRLNGPTSFAPLIRQAIKDTYESGNMFHILVIIADGQVSNPKETIDAIVEASRYPIAIVMIGVGDGPWDMMEDFDDNLPQRQFDNFQFVEYHRTVARFVNQQDADCALALGALMEIPDQVKALKQLKLI
ncbi:copine-9, variant [Capsaspora owczarzaki ATCC 30864]|uniref:Copine-9 n=1 Tax=Capsaspora owczarzaki (strain ATCC 30864) TaxID=595528 RepID=A0A0D2WPS9_CAPO3|nr:copine-9, variant [Capsaspora owczarzaki ATCC 30864]KJE93490.1 copine-9 [Capsaspora owczarzaki ATCC 30864]|eukprot:XP_011270373.1 copine-9, variant [Capsaspora owczarzaki ATCC 30864]